MEAVLLTILVVRVLDPAAVIPAEVVPTEAVPGMHWDYPLARDG